MFSDTRSKRIVLVAHCVLNQSALSDGTADYPGCMEEVVELLATSRVGILQMPCPELTCLGLARGNRSGLTLPPLEDNTRIRELMSVEPAATRLLELARGLAAELSEYRSHGFETCGVVAINRSPSCGVETTTDHGQEVAGRGVFIRALRQELEQRGIHIRMVGIKASEPRAAVDAVRRLLAGHAGDSPRPSR